MADVRPPERRELDDFASCVETGFATRFSAAERERFIESIEPQRCLIAVVEGELVATLKSHLVELTLPGPVVVEAAVVSETTVLPTHRRRGLLSAMLGRFLLDEHRRGEPIVVLAASEGTVYGRFGFGAATWLARYGIDRSRAELLDAGAPAGSVRLLSAFELRSCAPPIFDAVRRAGAGQVERIVGFWDELFAGLEAERDFAACYEEDGSIDGYAVYRIVPAAFGRRGREIVLVELVSTTPASYRALWSYVLGVDLVTRTTTEERPIDEPLRHLLVDPRALETLEVIDRTWVRLVDANAALRARRYGRDGAFVLEIEDELCPWNSGRVMVQVDDGIAEVQPTSEAPQLRLGASELAAIYLGGTSAVTLTAASRIIELADGAAERADAFFSAKPPPFCLSGL